MNKEELKRRIEDYKTQIILLQAELDKPDYDWKLASKLGVLMMNNGKSIGILNRYNAYEKCCLNVEGVQYTQRQLKPSTLEGHIRVHDGSRANPICRDVEVLYITDDNVWELTYESQDVPWDEVIAFIELPEIANER